MSFKHVQCTFVPDSKVYIKVNLLRRDYARELLNAGHFKSGDLEVVGVNMIIVTRKVKDTAILEKTSKVCR